MAVVVDTNIVSFIFKEDTRAGLCVPHLLNVPKFISFMSLAELYKWQSLHNWGKRKKDEFDELLSNFGIIYADEELCRIWAKIQSDARKKGNPIDVADAWIASVALLFDIPLVTHNRRDFINVAKLKIISES